MNVQCTYTLYVYHVYLVCNFENYITPLYDIIIITSNRQKKFSIGTYYLVVYYTFYRIL